MKFTLYLVLSAGVVAIVIGVPNLKVNIKFPKLVAPAYAIKSGPDGMNV